MISKVRVCEAIVETHVNHIVLPNGHVLIAEARSLGRPHFTPEQRHARLAAKFIGASPNHSGFREPQPQYQPSAPGV